MSAERWELRHPHGIPSDQRVIGVIGDEQTIVAGVPFLTEAEKRRAHLLKAAPSLMAALSGMAELAALLADNCTDRVDVSDDPRLLAATAALAEAEGRS